MQLLKYMKKKTVRRSKVSRATRRVSAAPAGRKNYLLLLKSWMFVVMFALMLGVGGIIGAYINQEMNIANPQVAGIQIEAQ